MVKIKKVFFPIFLILFQLHSSVYAQAATFKVLPQNAVVGFSIQYLKFWTVEGCFSDVYGGLIIEDDTGRLTGISGDIVIESLDSGFRYRDERLMSSTYFHQKQFPSIHFQSNSVVYRDRANFVITGTITIKGISKPVVFNGRTERFRPNPDSSVEQTIFLATGIVDREQFGIGPVEIYHPEGFLISRKVQFNLITSICRDRNGGETTCPVDPFLNTQGFACEKSGI